MSTKAGGDPTTEMSTMTIGWIGLGNMGLAMATNLQKHLALTGGKNLCYTNRTLSRGATLDRLKANQCNSVSEIVQRSDIVFISLSDDSALEAIASQILSRGSLNSKVFVDTSTVHPNTTASVAAKISERGAAFIAAPVFGATPVAAQGQLLFALAGPQHAVDIVKPLISSCLARSVIFVSTNPRDASLLKTTGNFITAAMAETISEAHVFAEKTGLSSTVLDELVRENYGAYAHSISNKLVTGVYAPPKGERPRSDLTLAIKDVGHGIDSAKEVGTRLKVAEITMEHLLEAKEWAQKEARSLDSSAVYGVVRQDAGLDFRTDVVIGNDVGDQSSRSD